MVKLVREVPGKLLQIPLKCNNRGLCNIIYSKGRYGGTSTLTSPNGTKMH